MKKEINVEDLMEVIKGYYPEGTRVELVRSANKFAPPVGTQGTVEFVDDVGNILVAWDNGVFMTAVLGEDVCRKIDKETQNDRPR